MKEIIFLSILLIIALVFARIEYKRKNIGYYGIASWIAGFVMGRFLYMFIDWISK